MDSSGQYNGMSQRPNLFQSQQLPPPSSLAGLSFARNNTLPPISQIPSSSGSYPPPRYQHPSLSSAATLPPPLTSPTSLPWPSHRTSSSRDEQQLTPPLRHSNSRSKLIDRDDRRDPPPSAAQEHPPTKHEGEDGMPSTSDFVKKLYKMLEDTSFSHVVSWGPQGDCFVVKDMNEFTKSILPRMFKHSNFASFVRQLNKYDFHKVKNTDDNQFGEHSWTFRHPDFHADRRDALENIKRKVPAARKSTNGRAGHSPTPTSSASTEALQSQIDRMMRTQDEMAAHIRNLENNYQNVLNEMVNFQRNMAQQDGLMQNLIQYFLQLENAKVKAEEAAGSAPQGALAPDPNPFLPATEAQRMMGDAYSDTDVARASLAQMNEISRRAEVAGMTFSTGVSASNPGTVPSASRIMAAVAGLLPGSERETPLRPLSRQDALARIEELQRARPASAAGQRPAQVQTKPSSSPDPAAPTNAAPPSSFETGAFQGMLNPPTDESAPFGQSSHEGLQVFTVGHLMPKSSLDDENGNWTFDSSSINNLNNAVVMPTPIGMGGDSLQEGENVRQQPLTIEGAEPAPTPVPGRSENGQKLRVRRSTYVPGWAVPPKVLLVDDDAVSRKLSSKFLQVAGCSIDVAVDGVSAVTKMNLEKYDLVLMDIVMPKLDGVSATSLIRQFDHMTPIISMTSNSKPNEIMTYYSSGMNDVLPKPFTRDGLTEMLEKHLMHLKVIQTMSRIPRSVGIPPLSDSNFDQALTVQAANMVAGPSNGDFSIGDDDGKINPLAGMGLTDEQYTMILQNIVAGESFSGVGIPSMDGVGSISGLDKRPLEDSSDDRDGKRGRFELIE